MTDRYDFEITENGSKGALIQKGDWLIEIWPKPSMYQKEYAPSIDFYTLIKGHHSNGIISSYTKVIGHVAFGERWFYNEKGELIKEIDEDAKFGKIKPGDFVDILEKIGWINRKTGENVVTKEPLKTDGSFTMKLHRAIEIYFFPAEYDKDGKEIKPPMWRASYTSEYLHDNIMYHCYINGNTGEYKFDQHEYYVIP